MAQSIASPDAPKLAQLSATQEDRHVHLRDELIRDLRELGLRPGDLVMVHSSMRAVGPILGGPNEMIEALLAVVGSDGTVMMYVDWEDGAQSLTRTDRDQQPAERLIGRGHIAEKLVLKGFRDIDL